MTKQTNENEPKKASGSHLNPSRRQFLKDVGMMAGGVAITSMFVSSACTSGNATPTTTATTSRTITGTTTPTTQPTSTPVTTSQPATTTPTTTTTWNGVYEPSLIYDRPEMGEIIGCEAEAAMDRLYAREHMWVKIIEDDVVAIGITERFLFYFELVVNIQLKDVGTTIQRGAELATIEGNKMTVDSVSPVSGTILQNNQELLADLDSTINRYPYITGWLHVVQLSQPQELNGLMSPEEYIDYISSHLDA